MISLPSIASATVYEFGSNGTITKHEAVDYLSKNRHKNTAQQLYWPPQKKAFDKYVAKASKKYGISPDLIHAVILTESSYKYQAISPKGAKGLLQLMPNTAKQYGVLDSFDPEQNINGGTRYLQYLISRYKEKPELALAAYNAGETAVARYNGIPPYPETKEYVEKIRTALGGTWDKIYSH